MAEKSSEHTRHPTRRRVIGGIAAGTALAATRRRSWAQAGPIKIGVPQTISGSLAIVGNGHVLGAQIAAKQINDAGGIDGRQLELVIRDTRASANDMVAAMREMAGDGVNLIMGEAFSTPNLAAVPIAPSLNIVYVAPTVIAMELTHDLYNRNCFRAGQNAYMQFLGQAKTVVDHNPNLKRWGCLVADAAGFRQGQTYLYYGLKKFYAQKGQQIELMEPAVAKVGATDYRTQSADLASQNLDGLVIAATGAELISFLKQARGFGLFQNVKTVADMTYSPQLGPTMKRELPQDYWTTCTWVYDAFKKYPMTEDFYKRAVEATKVPLIDPFLAQSHLAITTIVAGVRAAKSTATDAVIQALETITYDTVYGPMKFRAEDHQLQFNPGYMRLGPDEGEAGWKVNEFVQIDWKDAIEPPGPGKKFELG